MTTTEHVEMRKCLACRGRFRTVELLCAQTADVVAECECGDCEPYCDTCWENDGGDL